MTQKITDVSSDENLHVGAATHANVFRLRTPKNKTWNVAYFLNCGSLDGQELIHQLLLVITCCHLAGFWVLCIVSDAGGGNKGLVALLTKGKSNRIGPGLPDKIKISFKNPMSPELVIFIVFCAVHGLKNMRNQLYAGRVGGPRRLTNNGDIIEWERLVSLWTFLEQDTNDRSVRKLRKVTKNVVIIDSFSSMKNVSHAKVPFEEDTIVFQCALLAKKMNCDNGIFDDVKTEFEGMIGCHSEILQKKVDILKEVVSNSLNQDFKNEMAQIEFAMAVHMIFISRFLNKNARLVLTEDRETRDRVMCLNVIEERKRMTKYIGYFDSWKKWLDQEKNPKNTHTPETWGVDKWERLFISTITITNLKICISGFLSYAEYVLTSNPQITFVPYLHANQSSLESFFSGVRATHLTEIHR